MKHLILYDDACPFCQKTIHFILKKDHKKQFLFSSLKGKVAHSFENTFPINQNDSVILVEHYSTQNQRFYSEAKAALKILWYLGGFWALIGWKFILPAWSINWVYRLIAKNRFLFCKNEMNGKFFKDPDRFLP